MCKDMEELCPNAIFLNSANPMAINIMAINKSTSIEAYGLCPGVHSAISSIADYIKAPKESVSAIWAGINHNSWFLKYEVDGKDAYPALKEIAKSQEKIDEVCKYEKGTSGFTGLTMADTVRFQLLDHFGYFVSETPYHMSEYVPYFRKNKNQIEELRIGTRYWLEHVKEANDKSKYVEEVNKLLSMDKIELKTIFPPIATEIIRAIETGKLNRVSINVINNGIITNLPDDCCVEVPAYIDSTGIHPSSIGNLPEQIVSLIMTNIGVQKMATKAIIEKNKEKKKEYIMQAIKLDPLTSCILTLDKITLMVEELIEANKEYIDL
jgi:alpha-galactosidase